MRPRGICEHATLTGTTRPSDQLSTFRLDIPTNDGGILSDSTNARRASKISKQSSGPASVSEAFQHYSNQSRRSCRSAVADSWTLVEACILHNRQPQSLEAVQSVLMPAVVVSEGYQVLKAGVCSWQPYIFVQPFSPNSRKGCCRKRGGSLTVAALSKS